MSYEKNGTVRCFHEKSKNPSVQNMHKGIIENPQTYD